MRFDMVGSTARDMFLSAIKSHHVGQFDKLPYTRKDENVVYPLDEP